VPRGATLLLLFAFAARSLRRTAIGDPNATSAVGRVAVVFFCLYMLAPKVLADWYYCSARFLLFATFLLPALVEVPSRYASRVPALGAVLALCVVACDLPQLSRLSRQLQDVIDVGAELPPGAKIIAMDFADRRWGAIDKPQPLAHAWELLVTTRNAVGSQLPAAGKPRTGGERFRMLSFRPGVLDVTTGTLPWSSYEGAYDVVRPCQEGTREACRSALAARKNILDKVRDRYEYVLMLSPPALVRELLAEGLTLRRQVGMAWLYETMTRRPALDLGPQ
jgi:hypothetical protein